MSRVNEFVDFDWQKHRTADEREPLCPTAFAQESPGFNEPEDGKGDGRECDQLQLGIRDVLEHLVMGKCWLYQTGLLHEFLCRLRCPPVRKMEQTQACDQNEGTFHAFEYRQGA